MFGVEFPYFNMQQLNLDWVIDKIKGMLSFLPDDGAVGQILRRTADGAEWSDETSDSVESVNGKTGAVVLDADDIMMNNNESVEDSVSDLKSALYKAKSNPTWEFGFIGSDGLYSSVETKAHISHATPLYLYAGSVITFVNTFPATYKTKFEVYKWGSNNHSAGTIYSEMLDNGSSARVVITESGYYRIYTTKQYQVLWTDAQVTEFNNDLLIMALLSEFVEKNTSDIDSLKAGLQTVDTTVTNVADMLNSNLLEDVTWEVGSIDPSNGALLSSTNRVRTADYVPIVGVGVLNLSVLSGFKYVVDWFTSQHSIITGGIAGIWQTSALSLTPPENAAFIKIIVADTSDGAANISYGSNVSAIGTFKIVEAVLDNDSNAFVNKKNNNARHVAHAYNATATPPLTLLHFSDLHADKNALGRIIEDSGRFDIDGMICTGDMVANTGEAISSWWNSNVMTCIGNHDSATYSGGAYNWTAVSMANRDAYYIAPFESGWGITHTSGTSYYYKDYATQKVRLIVMDGMLYNDNGTEATAQTSWLENLLADAITNNLHVLIAIHAPHGGATAEDCSFSKYAQGVMPTNSDCNTPQTVVDTVAAKITAGLKFIGYIVGHTHQDNMWDAENDGKQLMYCVTCAAVAQSTLWCNSDQHRSTTEDAFNLVTVDTDHTLVKIIRGGGADIDDHMRTRKAICFDYSTGQKVGEVL